MMHLEPVTWEQPDVFTVLTWADILALPVARLGGLA